MTSGLFTISGVFTIQEPNLPQTEAVLFLVVVWPSDAGFWKNQHLHLHSELSEQRLEKLVQRSCGGVQGQIGQDLEQPEIREGVPAHGRG